MSPPTIIIIKSSNMFFNSTTEELPKNPISLQKKEKGGGSTRKMGRGSPACTMLFLGEIQVLHFFFNLKELIFIWSTNKDSLFFILQPKEILQFSW